jgi:hypothetical protein
MAPPRKKRTLSKPQRYYTFNLFVCFETGHTFTEKEVRFGSGEDESDVQPTDKALAELGRQFMECAREHCSVDANNVEVRLDYLVGIVDSSKPEFRWIFERKVTSPAAKVSTKRQRRKPL